MPSNDDPGTFDDQQGDASAASASQQTQPKLERGDSSASTGASWMSSLFSTMLSPISGGGGGGGGVGASVQARAGDDDDDESSNARVEHTAKENDDNMSLEQVQSDAREQPTLGLGSDKESRRQLWQQVYSYMGSNLSGMRLSLPIWLFEPTTALTRMAETFEYSDLLDRAATTPDPILRDSLVTAFVVSTFSNTQRVRKPFNPVLGETYEFIHPVTEMKLYAEQVSHHPPISASFVQGSGWEASEVINVHAKFQGNSMEMTNSGYRHIRLTKFDDLYTWNMPTAVIFNLFVGRTHIDHQGAFEIINHTTGNKIKLDFLKNGWFQNNRFQVSGDLYNKDGEVLLHYRGAWNRYLDSSPVNKDDLPIEKQKHSANEAASAKKTEGPLSALSKKPTTSSRPKQTTFQDVQFTPTLTSVDEDEDDDDDDDDDEDDDTRETSEQSDGDAEDNGGKDKPETEKGIPFHSMSSSSSQSSNAEPVISSKLASATEETPSFNIKKPGNPPTLKSILNTPSIDTRKVLPPSPVATPSKNVAATDGCNRLWVAGPHLLSDEEGGGAEGVFANCTKFTKRTVAFDADYAAELPPNDSRLRPDRIALERGEHPKAAEEKLRIEQLQRDRRTASKAAAAEDGAEEAPQPKFFVKMDEAGDKWEPNGTYWSESRSFADDEEKCEQASLW